MSEGIKIRQFKVENPTSTLEEDISKLPLVSRTELPEVGQGQITQIVIENDFIYTGQSSQLQKFHKENFAYITNHSGRTFSSLQRLEQDNDVIFVAAFNILASYFKENLALASNASVTPDRAYGFAIDNDFVYAGRLSTNIKQYHKSNLVFITNFGAAANYEMTGGIHIDNEFIYVGGGGGFLSGGTGGITKYHKNNLALVANVGAPRSTNAMTIDNDFIYIGGGRFALLNDPIQKYHKSNLVLVGNTSVYAGGNMPTIQSIIVDNDFIYAGGGGGVANFSFSGADVKKWHKGNLVFVGNTQPIKLSEQARINDIRLVIENNEEFLYVVGNPGAINKHRTKRPFKVDGKIIINENEIYIKEDLK